MLLPSACLTLVTRSAESQVRRRVGRAGGPCITAECQDGLFGSDSGAFGADNSGQKCSVMNPSGKQHNACCSEARRCPDSVLGKSGESASGFMCCKKCQQFLDRGPCSHPVCSEPESCNKWRQWTGSREGTNRSNSAKLGTAALRMLGRDVLQLDGCHRSVSDDTLSRQLR